MYARQSVRLRVKGQASGRNLQGKGHGFVANYVQTTRAELVEALYFS